MTNIRRVGSRLARDLVCHDGVSRLLCMLHSRPRVLMLHGVGTPELPTGVFQAQISFLTRVFRIVPLEQMWDGASDGRGRPKVALTFDDGLRNNFLTAYPILREFGAPATFFICPGLIGTRRWLWNHECRERLRILSAEHKENFALGVGAGSTEIEAIVRKLKDMPYSQRALQEKQLRNLTPDFNPTQEQHRQYDIMSWEELRALDPKLISIGGHSTSHQILTRLDAQHLEEEVGGCKAWLQEELGRPIQDFCYPDGDYDAKVLNCVERHFKTAVTTNEGWIPLRPSLFELPRIPIARNLPDFAWRMHRPQG